MIGYNKRLSRIKKRNAYLKQKNKLISERNKYTIKPPSTSKLILWMVVLICVEIVFFSEFAMLHTGDTSALYALIGVPATLIPTVLGYYYKAAKENCKDGLVYMAKQAELGQNVNVQNEPPLDNKENEIESTPNMAG